LVAHPSRRLLRGLIELVDDLGTVLLARLLQHEELFQKTHSLGSILAVSLRLHDEPLLLGNKGLTLSDALFGLSEPPQENFPFHALRLWKACETSGSLGIVSARRVSSLITKAVNFFFRRRAVQPLKGVFDGRTMKPLKYLLQAGLELQFKSDCTPPTERAGARKFACAPFHVLQGFAHYAPHI